MSTWRLDGTGIVDNGNVGGDIQAGPAWSVRYVRDDMPGSLITETVYAVDWKNATRPERGHNYAYQIQTEFLVCTDPSDPGGTEVWSDVHYEDSYLDGYMLAEAKREAREVAKWLNTEAQAGVHGWDGKPDYRQ